MTAAGGEGAEASEVLYACEGGVATLTLNRPAALNALNEEMRTALLALIERAAADPAVRCVVLRGAGAAFMAGGDITMMAAELGADRAAYLAGYEMRILRTNQIVHRLRRMPKPVVAAVHGPCAGFGLGLALAADICIARDDAIFVTAFRNLGLSGDGGVSWLLPRAVGERRALLLSLMAERIGADEARAIGLVSMTAPADAFEARLAEVVARLASGPAVALARIKDLHRSAFDRDWDAQLAREAEAARACVATADFAEGVDAFLARRRPRFTGA